MNSTLFMSWSLVVLIAMSFCVIVYLILRIQSMSSENAVTQLKEKESEIKNEVMATSIDDLIAAENHERSDPSDSDPSSKH